MVIQLTKETHEEIKYLIGRVNTCAAHKQEIEELAFNCGPNMKLIGELLTSVNEDRIRIQNAKAQILSILKDNGINPAQPYQFNPLTREINQ